MRGLIPGQTKNLGITRIDWLRRKSLCRFLTVRLFFCDLGILTWKQLRELVQFGNWHPHPLYYMRQVAAALSVSCDKVNKEYQVLALRWRASKGESGTKGFMPWLTQPPIPLRLRFIFSFVSNWILLRRECMRNGNAHFRGLWNLLQVVFSLHLRHLYTLHKFHSLHITARKYAVWNFRFWFLLSIGTIFEKECRKVKIKIYDQIWPNMTYRVSQETKQFSKGPI